MEVEEVRKKCCVVVSHGKEWCELYLIDGEMMKILPFLANQVDPTGAGDNFLGGFVAGLVQGLPVPDVALLGNLRVYHCMSNRITQVRFEGFYRFVELFYC
ncbi:hypothetical protein Ddye_028599 [Dipteronia dyeriana]|uniref:Carbohydrate kinase PfkB domain-containing protein n=1 Tax=Dipteronia dyeriana TaxID=168575 RepID=A0AAD9TDL0_9ROSI|nr:hypothetical protein Ddye_028599 [Dipteronia dyeriana]